MKRALVLSGGGSKGAWQAGAAYALASMGRRYDIITGISVGAINGAFLAMYGKAEEEEGARELVNFWKKINTKSVYKRWFPFGMLHGLWKPSFYNSKALSKMIYKNLDPMSMQLSGKKLRVGAVSLNDGKYRLWSQNDEDIAAGVLASSSFPGFLSPIKIDGHLWSDGGLRNITPLKSAIDLGADEVDILMTINPESFDNLKKNPNTLSILKRTVDVMIDELVVGDIKQCLLINDIISTSGRFLQPHGKKYIHTNIIQPSSKIKIDSLSFEPKDMEVLIERGIKDVYNSFSHLKLN